MKKQSKKSKVENLVIQANKLQLNLVHFMQTGVGADFLFQALQHYENARANYTEFFSHCEYTEELRQTFLKRARQIRYSDKQEKEEV